jgi:rhodanese-related sulfurtransferase
MTGLYSGDISPSEAMKKLKQDPNAQLIDVRTSAEWQYVGAPDLRPLNKRSIKIQWRELPNMDLNEDFVEELEMKVPSRYTVLLFLCRTGGRSREAAIAMTEHGYKNCYNIDKGFEGDLDPNMHRGNISGWKAEKLPWKQD